MTDRSIAKGLQPKSSLGRIIRQAAIATLTVLVVTSVASLLAHCWTSEPIADWFAAIGTVVAIVVAVIVALGEFQQAETAEAQRRLDLGAVAYDLAASALELVTDRLDVCLVDKQPGSRYELREHRTTETIAAMREMEPQAMPPEILTVFVELRSCIYAMNEQISAVYAKDAAAKRAAKRWERSESSKGRAAPPDYDRYRELASCVRVHRRAATAFDQLGDLAYNGFGVTKKPTPARDAVSGYALS